MPHTVECRTAHRQAASSDGAPTRNSRPLDHAALTKRAPARSLMPSLELRAVSI